MSADFFASYASGVIGILIGNPLDIVKVRLQAGNSSPITSAATISSFFRGTAAPSLGYGALNSILFVTYNRTTDVLKTGSPANAPSLWTVWIAGAVGGLATWVVSTPSELIKCRSQLSTSGYTSNSWRIAKHVIRTEGLKGLYLGGVVTALRDSIGYGFYFWSYELSSSLIVSEMKKRGMDSSGQETVKTLVCGGLAGVVTWASVFPLDVIKTRVQAQVTGENSPLLRATTVDGTEPRKLGAMEIARNAYKTEGPGVFFKGLTVCSVRAFIVNAAQWAVYEYLMKELSSKERT
ncbi:mitochondrial carrier domain-containing protein [Bisporella sp. PMI_857]|nr:mitochondrial carrier domain-containing protein [Bisporella sp. PMI_857]